MKKLNRVLMGIALLALVACNKMGGGTAGGPLKVGDPVAATFASSFYLAKITTIKGDKYDVLFTDNNTGTDKSADEVKAIPADPQLKVGDSVMAVSAGDRFDEATVKEIQPDGFLVQWTSAAEPTLIPKGKLLKKW